MQIRGKVENGQIVLPEGVELPEGATVSIQVRNPHHLSRDSTSTDEDDQMPTMYERMKPLIGLAKNLPPDAAQNVDHYLFGLPKIKESEQ